MSAQLYGAFRSNFREELKAAITPELKIQACESARIIARATLKGFWQLLALAFIGLMQATIRLPKE